MSMNKRKKRLESQLDVRQRKAALLLIERDFAEGDGERITHEQIAEACGVTRKTLFNWRTQNKAFIEYTNIVADEFLESKRSSVYRQLMKLIEGSQPSVKGIDLYLRRHGLLTDKTIVEQTDVSGGRSNGDIEKELSELDELLGGERGE